MPRYSDELLNEIFSQNDIVDYVSQYVKLRKNGRDYTGLCPFHKEKSPSFHVNQEKQLFHCFGCGAGGNLVQFVMRSEGLDFVEAVKLMADRAGIILPEDDMPVDDKLYQKKKRILEINKTAARFYYQTLTKDNTGSAGIEYLKKRAIDAKTVAKYGLGFALNSFDALKKYLNKLGYSDSELLDAGLLISKNGKCFDKFRNRVMFPIIDLRGNVIAFGGRRVVDNPDSDGYTKNKYINSPDTPVFNKGKNLFSLNLAKKDCAEQCILCEGYLDVISVYKSGVPNIVATLGTALTDEQAKLLMKYTEEIVLCYDSDEAGQAATKRAIEIINSVGGKCKIMQLKGAKDPDEYINKNGVARFKEVVLSATPSTEYLLNQIRKKYNLDTEDGKILYVEEAATVLSKIQNAIEVDAYVKKISDETEISKDAIYAEVKKHKSAGKISNGVTKTVRTVTAKKSASITTLDAEKRLLSLIISNKASYTAVKEEFLPSDFSTDTLRRLAEIIYACYENGEVIDPPVIMAKFSSEEADFVSNIFCNLETYSNEKVTVIQLVNTIRLQSIDEKIKQAEKEKDVLKLKELLDLRLKLEGNKKCQI